MNKKMWLVILLPVIFITGFFIISINRPAQKKELPQSKALMIWTAPNINNLPAGEASELIRYGKELISNTALYLGPKGTVLQSTNGINCQNCHLDAGTRLNSNCLAAVANTYPKYRNRSGKIETIAFRINECLERSLNGKALDTLSREMKAIKAYLIWLGSKSNAKNIPGLSGSGKLAFLPRSADTIAGKNIYALKCVSCHGQDGQGLMRQDSLTYEFPPLWGASSYNVSAGMYRLSSLAAFIKYSMPFTPKQQAPQLTDEDAWDVAAFICSRQRPQKFFKTDWPNPATKPPDYPFGPFTDSFSTWQHKYGPFEPIVAAKKKMEQ